jgi:fluoroacetyl-CoA thioesterase
MGLAVGLRATVRHVVTEADTAIAAGSGDVPVLGTPRLLALAEAACVAALEPHLDPGMTSVGTGVALEHRRRLVFAFIARHRGPLDAGRDLDQDEELVAGAGSVERIVVDRDKFLARAALRPD